MLQFGNKNAADLVGANTVKTTDLADGLDCINFAISAAFLSFMHSALPASWKD